ncbi:zinc knuckle CX2CX4HX4C containing protein [Tanacetum coccineum]|uniref:Zinc knuckle CX2CX4HX4C containing protein n=1 Tax=Tanacetum coccineum TaxID=301880 RepID=A0ABQ5G9U9_9ASTR
MESNFRSMVADKVFDDVNISIPRKVVEKAKYGLKRIVMNAKGFFFFKFDSWTGLDAVLEGGPWMIHNSSIILKKWSMNTSLQKEELTRIPIWVKLHDVPIQVFEEDGISLIAIYLGKPIMLDSYTSSMCKESWGRSSFAQCLIEINSEAKFLDYITIGIPDLDGPGYTKVTIRVEYEWKPPRCLTCNIFGRTGETCLKKVATDPGVNDNNSSNDGFQKVVNRRRNHKGSSAGNKLPKGVPVSKGFQVGKDFVFKPKALNVGSKGDNGTRDEPNSKVGPSKTNNNGESLSTKDTNVRQQDTGKKKISNIASPNSFAALGVDDDEEEEVENIWDESKNLNLYKTGASTPAQTVSDVYVYAILESHVDVVAVYDICKKVNTRADHKTLFCSFVYADNYYIDRRVLWSNLVGHVGLMKNRPWILLGDFNAALNLEDHSTGAYEPMLASTAL